MTEKRAVIISGGHVEDYVYIRSFIIPGDMVICADRGYEHARRMSLEIEALVGDFDSLGYIPDGVNTVSLPAKKDLTDTEYAIQYARKQGCRDFLLLGCTGARMDHALSNILHLCVMLDRGERGIIIDEHSKIMITRTVIHLYEPQRTIISLIPLSPCSGVTTSGLEYPLDKSALAVGSSLGVSNVMTAERAEVKLESGTLLVIVARD